MPSKSKKKASLRAPAKNWYPSDSAITASLPNDTSTPSKILSPTASGDSASAPVARYTSTVWRPDTGSENT